jgi:hypothetical protein
LLRGQGRETRRAALYEAGAAINRSAKHKTNDFASIKKSSTLNALLCRLSELKKLPFRQGGHECAGSETRGVLYES